MLKNKILILITCMFLISLTSASDLGTFKQNECVSLYQTCEDCTYVNVTSITYPNSSTQNINQVMTKNGQDYTYSFCNTSVVGNYLYNTCGDKKSSFTCEEIYFEITPTGTEFTEAKSNLLVSSFIVLIIATIFFLVLGLFAKNVPFKIFFIGLSIVFMVTTLGFSVSVWQQIFGTLGNLVEAYGKIFILLTILLTGGGIGLIVYLVYLAIMSFWNNSRGMMKDDD